MNLCMNCMKEIGEQTVCPDCGWDQTESLGNTGAFLPPGFMLQERYILGTHLGQGGFGITYIGYDQVLNHRVAVKEYYPGELARRDNENVVVAPLPQMTEAYQKGREQFLQEARMLAKFADHPCVVGVKDCFEENGTAYMVMEYLDGVTLKEYLQRSGDKVSVEAAISILTPVMDALQAVHWEGIIHRDISPDNIFITTDSRVRLIDFGAARQFLGGQKSLSIMLKPGYAPEEQYRSRGNQGPWTDVYALTATFYRMVTGIVPPESFERVMQDELEIPSSLPEHIRTAIQMGMALRAVDRFSSVEQLRQALMGRPTAAMSEEPVSKLQPSVAVPQMRSTPSITHADAVTSTRRMDTKKAATASEPNWPLIAGLAVILLLCMTVIFVVVLTKGMLEGAPDPISPAPVSATAEPTDTTVSLPDLYIPGHGYKGKLRGIAQATLITSQNELNEVTKGLQRYYDQYSAFVASGERNKAVFCDYMEDCLVMESEAMKNQWNYFVNHHITEYQIVNSSVKSVKKSGDRYYVWADEAYRETDRGKTVSRNSSWVYLLERQDGALKAFSYTSDPSAK